MLPNRTSASAHVIDIPHERLDEAVDVLTLAFEHAPAPLMRYFFSGEGPTYRDCLRAMLRFVCESQLVLEDLLKGCVHQGRLVGVACVTGPESNSWPDSLNQSYEAFKSFVGPDAALRLKKVGHATAKHRPDGPHFYLAVIGVHRQAQAKGFGRALLNSLHALAETHPASAGVSLDTANPSNVPLYEHFGYHIVAKTRFDDIHVWSMFRPNVKERQ